MNNLLAQLIIIALIGGIIFTVKFLCSTIGEGDSGYSKLKKQIYIEPVENSVLELILCLHGKFSCSMTEGRL